MRKILFIILIFITISGILSVSAQTTTPTETTGTGSGTTTGTTSSGTGELKDFQAGDTPVGIGDRVGPTLDKGDVTIKNALANKENGKTQIDFIEGLDSSLELKGKVAGVNTINNLKRPENAVVNNEVTLNEKGQVIKTDLTIGDKKDANGKYLGQDLDIKKVKFNAPEGSRVQLNEVDKIIKVDLKAGTQISKVPSKRDKITGDDEEQGKVQYRSPNDYVKLPDYVATSLGAKSSVEFKGTLSHDGNNWLIDSGKDVRWKIDGKESVFSPNIHDKIAKADENLKVFFGDFDKKTVNGAYVGFAKDSIRWGSTSANEAHPLSILKDNPWGVNVGDKGFLGGVPFEKSEFYIKKDAATGKSSFGLLGSGLVGDDYSTYKFEELANGKVDIKFKEGISMQGLGVSGKPTNVQTDILPFKADGTAYSTKGNKLIIGTGTESNFNVVKMNEGELNVGRVMMNRQPVESTGTIPPAVPPQPEPAPIIPAIKVEPPKPNPTQVLNQLTGTQIGPILQSMMKAQGSVPAVKNFLSSLENKDYKGFAVIFTDPVNCGPCRMMETTGVISGFGKTYTDIKVITVPVDLNDMKSNPLVSQYGIGPIPAIHVFDSNGNLRGGFVGGKTSALDFNGAVRAELAKPLRR